MESTVDTDYNALVLEARKRFSSGPAVQRQLHASRSRRTTGRRRTTFFSSNQAYDSPTARANGVDSVMAPSNNDRRHRFVGSFHFQPDYMWGIGVGGILTLESRTAAYAAHQRLVARGCRARPSRHDQRHRRLQRRTVGWASTASGRRAARRSTCAPRRSSASAARPGPRSCGRSSTSSTPRTTRTFGDTAFDVVTASLYLRRGDQRRHRDGPARHRVPRADHGQLELLGHARHAAGAQAHLLDGS